jgi:hypothetical protein
MVMGEQDAGSRSRLAAPSCEALDLSRASPAVRRLPTREGLLLIDTATNRLLAYNSSAGEVWHRLEGGATVDELVSGFAERFGIPIEIARRDVSAILREWRGLGLIGSNGRQRPAALAALKVPDWTPDPNWAVQVTFTIRDTVFAFAAEAPHWSLYAELFLRHLETPTASADVRIDIRSTSAGEAAVLVDGVERVRSQDDGLVMGTINRTILEHLHPGIEWMALIHGAAVARHGIGIALPAACGSGKTTLTAFLLPRGYDYLADDLIALAAPDGRLVPWPMPISIKEGSWNILTATYRDLPGFPQYRTKRGNARFLVPSPRVWDVAAVPFGSFVFPRYRPGAAAALTPITAFDALQRLLGDQIWFGYPITEGNVLRFLAWLDDKPAFDLSYGDVADAARLIDGIS